MIRAGIADMVMLACDLTTAGRPVIGRSGFREQDSSRAGCHESAVAAPGSASLNLSRPADLGGSGRSARRWGPQCACTARRRTLRSLWHIRFTRTCPGGIGRQVMDGQ